MNSDPANPIPEPFEPDYEQPSTPPSDEALESRWAPTCQDSQPPEDGIRSVVEAELADRSTGYEERITAAVCSDLLRRGTMYHIEGEPRFDTAMYFEWATKTLHLVHSDALRQAVSDYYGINRGRPVWRPVWAGIENLSIAPETSRGITPEAYWASRADGCVYISHGRGSIVRIRANRVEVVDNGTDGVLFPVVATLPAWDITDPVDPFESCQLFSNMTTTSEHGRLLVKLWALSLVTCPPSKPPIVLAGPIGSGKTRLIVGLLQLYGMQTAGRVVAIDDDRQGDFWTLLDRGGVVIGDNADTRTRWLADSVAQASTGQGVTRRRLYSNSDTVALRPRAWIALTTARPDAFAADAGLADRLIVVRMDRRVGPTIDSALDKEIAGNRDAGMSWICQTIARALADQAVPPPGLNTRHPDYGAFAWRLGRAMGCEAETVAALRASECDKPLFCLENDPLGSSLMTLLGSGERTEFRGSAAQLLDALTTSGLLECEARMSPKGLGRRLESLWPHVEQVFDATKVKDRKGINQFSIRRRGGPV